MELDVPKEINGLIFTIKSVTKNKQISCEKCEERYNISCKSLFEETNLTKINLKKNGKVSGIGATEVVINIKNESSKKFWL